MQIKCIKNFNGTPYLFMLLTIYILYYWHKSKRLTTIFHSWRATYYHSLPLIMEHYIRHTLAIGVCYLESTLRSHCIQFLTYPLERSKLLKSSLSSLLSLRAAVDSMRWTNGRIRRVGMFHAHYTIITKGYIFYFFLNK